mgnify:FL=1|jgi:uncharacterized protein (DUF427 family)
MKATWNGEVVAESNETVVVDGNHYFPGDAIKEAFFVDSDTTSVCGWKGTANYYSLNVNGETNDAAAWVYRDTLEAAKNIEGYVAFWKGVEIVE